MRLWLKLALVAGMTLAILVPLMLIRAVIHERQQYRAEAVTSVAATVGGAQTIAGPVLRIPYTFMAESQVENKDGTVRTVRERTGSTLVVFPDTLTAKGDMKPETRRRGLHEVRVFEWQGDVAATFKVQLPVRDEANDLRIGTPVLVYGISDVRGVRGTPVLQVGGQAVELQQGGGVDGVSGMHAELAVPAPGSTLQLDARLTMTLSGTETLSFLPLAQRNDIALRSSWPHPQFQGLSASHDITAGGFQADWQINALATTAQQRWRNGNWSAGAGGSDDYQPQPADAIGDARDMAQVSLMDPVNTYVNADRATKYGILFVLLTFIGFFMFELVRQIRVHPIQYLLVGLAIAIFFLLLVSLSEHIAFAQAYGAAALACIGLITFYLSAVLGSAVRAAGFGAMLVTLYAALYGLLIMEDNALVVGAGLLFVILAGIMIVTRKMDWYALSGAGPRKPPPLRPQPAVDDAALIP